MNSIKKGISLLAATLSITMLVAGCGNTVTNVPAGNTNNQQASSGDKIVMRLGHTLSPDSHYQLTALEFARLIKEKTNGKIEIQVYPQSQLGGEVQMTQALSTGTLEMEISAQPPIVNTIKEWSIFDLPYLFDSVDQGNKILQGPVGKKYLDMLPSQNIVGLTWLSVLERDLFTTKKPIKTLADLKSLKLRVIQSPGYINGYRSLGANPTPLAYNELYLALQQGLVDGGETAPDQYIQDKFTEVSKYFSLTHVNYLPVALAISKSSWDKLSPDLQKVLQETAIEAAQFDIKTIKKQTEEAFVTMKQKGVEVVEVDTKPWEKAIEDARTDLLSKFPNGEALYKEILAAKQAK
jgi:tripartite ATP-independent transporter DctP family solute receptor